MNYQTRLTALQLARDITPNDANADTLIENAEKIEAHLTGKLTLKAPTLDFAAKLPEHAEEVQTEMSASGIVHSNIHWTGFASDTVRLFNSGSTLVNHARQVGMTTLLCHYAANRIEQGESVAFVTTNSATTRHVGQIINALTTGNEKLFTVDHLRGFADNPQMMRMFKADLVIVDGMAALPYSNETDFMASIAPMGARMIFASTPGQDRGLFYTLWRESESFFKVLAPYSTPFMTQTQSGLNTTSAATLRRNLGEDNYANQFECVFRKSTDA